MKKALQIAIDGPVAAGKSTAAFKVAERLGLIYIDTGAMYRVVALAARENKIGWIDETSLENLVKQLRISLTRPEGKKKDGRKVTVLLNGKDVSWEIRTSELGEGASVVSQYPGVRKVLVKMQQAMAKGKRVIMEGRDIGTRVLPKADLKIYLDADLEERVRRRVKQLELAGEKAVSAERVRREILTRDNREMTRKIDPLRPARGAWRLDTTGLSIEGVVGKISSRVASL